MTLLDHSTVASTVRPVPTWGAWAGPPFVAPTLDGVRTTRLAGRAAARRTRAVLGLTS